MANVSSFSGGLKFNYDKIPWTPEGFLLAYDVLMTIEVSGGSYGICLEEEYTVNSAEFLAYMLKAQSGSDMAYINLWGSGRWSAASTFQYFNNWTMKEQREDSNHEAFVEKRRKLMKLMADNGWSFIFDYIDEEGGFGFIDVGSATIEAVELPAAKEGQYGDMYAHEFVAHTETSEAYEHNLKNFSEVCMEDRESDYFYAVTINLIEILQVPETYKQTFRDWIIENNYDEHLSPWEGSYQELDDIPGIIQTKWKEKLDELSREHQHTTE